jgi:phage tail protein X
MATTETYVVETEGMMVDAMVWRRFRKPMPGLVERVLAMNPGIAEFGPYLPVGTSVTIPIDDQTGPKVVEVVKLWD